MALAHFHDSAPARSVRDQAEAWALIAAPVIAAGENGEQPFTGSTDREALAWLYSEDVVGKHGIGARVAADFGLPSESSVRMALKNGTGLRVPLVNIVAFIDRAAFRAASAAYQAQIEKDRANG